MPGARWSLPAIILRLRRLYGVPELLPSSDPFQLILWECCAYLVDDERRAEVYGRLIKETGGRPGRIAGTSLAELARLIEKGGGMRPRMRAEKLQQAANLVLDRGPAELSKLCEEEPKLAEKWLKQFPGIARPGADRILMIAGSRRTLAPESNGLRVLLRLGFGLPGRSYDRVYVSVVEDTAAELPRQTSGLVQAHLLLRQHGKTLCKATAPRCSACPLAARCPSAP